jgi:hypothetical protein
MICAAGARTASACPFCTALAPSLAQQRDAADIVALAEVATPGGANDSLARLRLHQVLRGADRLEKRDRLDVALDTAAGSGSLVLLFGAAGDGQASGAITWHAVPVNETSYAYFVRSPSLKTPTHERLGYFARYLEHADPLLAQDAYLEFGHAPFDQVARMAQLLPNDKLRAWLVDSRVPQARKGFYGLAIALAAPKDKRDDTARFLRDLVMEPADDFRAGYDGVLGGYLLLAGEPGLELIESRYFANPRAKDGDVRHALTAVRFYHEFGTAIPATRLASAVARLMARDEFAEAAITDLGRWQAWGYLAQVAGVYSREGTNARTRRAVVGYLLACPGEAAKAALADLRAGDPQGVAQAEQILAKTSSVPACE